MKKILSIALAVIMVMCFASCAEGDVKDDILEEDIVRPPVRETDNPTKAIYTGTGKTMDELVNNSGVVAYVRIKNWLGDVEEEQYKGITCFEADVIDTYKGDVPNEIVVIQNGTSEATHKDFPLFTYGKEMILFLESADDVIKETREKIPDQSFPDFEYENAYMILGGPCNIWYVATLDSGETYVIPGRATAVKEDFYSEKKSQNIGAEESGTISSKGRTVAQALIADDPIDNAGDSPDYVFEIDILTEYIKKVES